MGMTYAVGDIHGCIDQLNEMMWELWANGLNLEEDTIIFLGDYIDRGPDSRACVQYLIDLQDQYGADRVICLKGNHEDMCLHYYKMYERNVGDLGIAWLYNGGYECIKSYKAWADIHESGEEKMEPAHLEWMLNLPTMYENDMGYFVHAGFLPWDEKPQDTDDYHRMWVRHDFILNPKQWDKMVYFGHTAQKGNVLDKPEKIGIDTACVYGYKLSAIRCDDGKVFQVDGYVKKVTLGDEDYE